MIMLKKHLLFKLQLIHHLLLHLQFFFVSLVAVGLAVAIGSATALLILFHAVSLATDGFLQFFFCFCSRYWFCNC